MQRSLGDGPRGTAHLPMRAHYLFVSVLAGIQATYGELDLPFSGRWGFERDEASEAPNFVTLTAMFMAPTVQ